MDNRDTNMSIPDSHLGLTKEEIQLLRKHQMRAKLGSSDSGYGSNNSSTVNSRGGNNGLLLLDHTALTRLNHHFDKLMNRIAEQLDSLMEEDAISTMAQYDRAGHAIDLADAEICRLRTALTNIDELEDKFDKLRGIRNITRNFRAKLEGLESRLSHPAFSWTNFRWWDTRKRLEGSHIQSATNNRARHTRADNKFTDRNLLGREPLSIHRSQKFLAEPSLVDSADDPEGSCGSEIDISTFQSNPGSTQSHFLGLKSTAHDTHQDEIYSPAFNIPKDFSPSSSSSLGSRSVTEESDETLTDSEFYTWEDDGNPILVLVRSILAVTMCDSFIKNTASGHFKSCAGTQRASNSTTSKSTIGNSCTTGASNNISIESNRGGNEPDDLNGNEDRKRKRQSPTSKSSSSSFEGRFLACPFAKYDPIRYSSMNSEERHYCHCSSSCLEDIGRLKQHLNRVHCRPTHYCACCYEEFNSRELLDAHNRTRPACDVCEPRFSERITEDQRIQLKPKWTGKPKNEVWYKIWSILFPQTPLPKSPYVDEIIQDFLEYFRRDAPSRLSLILSTELGDSLGLDSERQRLLDRALEASVVILVQRMESERSGGPITANNSDVQRPSFDNQEILNRLSISSSLSTSNRSPAPVNAAGVAIEAGYDPLPNFRDTLGTLLPPFELHEYTNPSNILMELDDYMWNDLGNDHLMAISSDAIINRPSSLEDGATTNAAPDISLQERGQCGL